MDVRSMPPTNATAGATSVVGVPPRLGAPVPGTTGGLPALGGLSVLRNPMAQELQSMGRGEDSMLVHMTPGEVQGLQQLAMASGGSLTINPHTGLPEAGWLGKLLPTIAGVAASIAFPAVAPWVWGLGAGAIGTAATGDLNKGLMAGLGAWGGASLGGALKSLGSAAATTGTTAAGTAAPGVLAGEGAKTATGLGANALNAGASDIVLTPAFEAAKQQAAQKLAIAGTGAGLGAGAGAGAGVGAISALNAPLAASLPPPSSGFFSQFANASRAGIPAGVPAFVSKAAPYTAGLGLFSNVSQAMQPKLPKYEPEEYKSTYAGPYVPQQRTVRMPTPEEREQLGTGEFMYFQPSNPVPGFRPISSLTPEEQKQYGYAGGGMVSGGKGGSPSGAPPAPAPAPSSRPIAPSGPSQAASYANPFMSQFNPSPSRMSMLPVAPTSYSAPSGKGAQSFSRSPYSDIGSGIGGLANFFGSFSPGPVMSPYGYGAGNPATHVERRTPFSYASFTPVAQQIADRVSFPRYGFSGGGNVHMGDGSFVLDARTVSELGNGSSNAGKELLARMGGQPLDGPGDGVSDSIPARIGGKQEARVARDEVIMPPEAVRRIGKGNPKRGADKLYALMNKAHKARKKAKRGQDTKLARGLGAIA